MVIAVSVQLLVIATPVLAALYLRTLPEAPACPGCSAVTRIASQDRFGHLLREMRVSAVRECTRCGWRGRMRWRWAPRRIRRE